MTPQSQQPGGLSDMQLYIVEEEAEKWQGGRITRREFIRRVTLIAGGAAAAGGILLAYGCNPSAPESSPSPTLAEPTAVPTLAGGGATPTAQGSVSPDHVPENDPSITAQMVSIPAADGSTQLKAYTASPPALMARVPPPGVLVIHENRGLTDYIKDVVRRLGKAQYTALCVDLLSRQGGSDAHPDEGERIGLIGQLSEDQILSDLGAGLDYLKTQTNVRQGQVGVIGFCFGGGYTWRIATKRPDLKAAVAFYGPNPPLGDVPNIKAAVLGIYGGLDTRITGGEPQLDDALTKAGVTHQMKVYQDANHAFHNDTGPNYNPDAAKDAWQQTLAWLGKYLMNST